MPEPPNINLGLLRTFAVMSEVRSVTLTARRLDLTQSAVSHAIGRLRELFDDPLFIRKRTGFALTSRASELVVSVRELLKSAEQLFPPAAFDASRSGRRFQVLLSEPCMLAFGAAIFTALRRAGPTVVPELQTATKESERLVREGAVDLALWHAKVPVAGLHHRKICDDPLVGVVHAAHPLASALRLRSATPVEYAAYAAVVGGRPHSGAAGSLLLSLLSLDRGEVFATVPRKVAQASRRLCRELREFELPTRTARVTYWMFWNDRSNRDPGGAWLRQAVVDAVTDLPA